MNDTHATPKTYSTDNILAALNVWIQFVAPWFVPVLTLSNGGPAWVWALGTVCVGGWVGVSLPAWLHWMSGLVEDRAERLREIQCMTPQTRQIELETEYMVATGNTADKYARLTSGQLSALQDQTNRPRLAFNRNIVTWTVNGRDVPAAFLVEWWDGCTDTALPLVRNFSGYKRELCAHINDVMVSEAAAIPAAGNQPAKWISSRAMSDAMSNTGFWQAWQVARDREDNGQAPVTNGVFAEDGQ